VLAADINQAARGPGDALPSQEGLFADLYNTLLTWISNTETYTNPDTGYTVTEYVPNTDITTAATWQFINSVVTINAGSSSPQALATRYYTATQWYLRTGQTIGPDDPTINKMSNGIALNIFNEIINAPTTGVIGQIPTIDTIGADDATHTVDPFFPGSDSGGWAGNPLFQFFGTETFFLNGLAPDGGPNGHRGTGGADPNGTYDMFAAMYANQQSLYDVGIGQSILAYLQDTRNAIEAGNGTPDDDQSVLSGLSSDVDSWINSNYYNPHGEWSGLFTTFFNPGVTDNPFLGPQVYVGTLNASQTLTITNAVYSPFDENPAITPPEIIRMGNQNDTVIMQYSLPTYGLADGGPGFDTLDLSQVDDTLTVTSEPPINGNEALDIEGKRGSLYAYNFERLILPTAADPVVTLDENDVPDLKELDTGNGDTTVTSTVFGLKIVLGNGTDTISDAGPGSVIYAGQGQDTFNYSQATLIVDATANDEIMLGGEVLHGGIEWQGSQSGLAVGIDNTEYGKDTDGELVIIPPNADPNNPIPDEMFVANYAGGPGYSSSTAGIYIGTASSQAYHITDPALPGNWLQDQFEFVNGIYKAMYGLAFYSGVDPLVLDLTGAGINLTDTSSQAPMFDMNGTGFAVHTGWVESNVGILVRLSGGADGQIDNISAFVGSQGQSGFAALASYDANGDGVIDTNDPIYAQLGVWVDANSNGIVDPGEVETLAQVGITAINLNYTSQTDDFVSGNQVLGTASFVFGNGSSGTIADVSFHTDNFNTQYLGNTTVSSTAAALPNVKGFGTLTDLQVAMTNDQSGTLINTVEQVLPTLDVIDLPSLEQAVLPIMTAWAAAVQEIDPSGNLVSVTPTGHADLPILVTTGDSAPTVTDFAYEVTDDQGSYWVLASGNTVWNDGAAIPRPTLQQVLAQQSANGEWTTFSGAAIDFFDRYTGQVLPLNDVPQDPTAALANLGPVLNQMWNSWNEIAVALAMQGPLAQYFPGITYDASADAFSATTPQELTPMYEAIFAAAPTDPTAATNWLDQWKPILDIVLEDFARASGMLVTYAYRFDHMVAAYEAVGLPIDIGTAAGALGIPSDLLVTGSTSTLISNNDDADIFYLSDGNQTAIGGTGPDSFVLGGNFGNVTIHVDQPPTGPQNQTSLWFSTIASTDVTAARNGLDLILTVNGTGQSVTVTNEFFGYKPGLDGGDVEDAWGVAQIIFADGVVWNAPAIAWAVSPTDNGVNGTLIGTPAMDVLDGGRGNHFLSGGDGGDVYLYDRGDGADTIDVNKTDLLITAQNYVNFGPGLTTQDVNFTRAGNSNDLVITVNNDPSDTLTIQGQFAATFTGVFGTQYFNQVEVFQFSDGTIYSWQDVENMILAQEEAVPNSVVYGFDSDNTIDPGTAGGDTLIGGNGNDTYVFGLGYGNDTIDTGLSNILSSSGDTVLFNSDVDPATVQVERDGGSNDVRLVLSDGSTLTIEGQFAATFTGVFGTLWLSQIANFQFQDANQTLWTAADIEQKAIAYEETNGSHAVYGFATDDTIDPGIGGNDFMSGGDGNDTYVFGLGYGHDQIRDAQGNILSGSNDTVLFNPDVLPSQVQLTRTGASNDLEITLSDGSELDVLGQFNPHSPDEALILSALSPILI